MKILSADKKMHTQSVWLMMEKYGMLSDEYVDDGKIPLKFNYISIDELSDEDQLNLKIINACHNELNNSKSEYKHTIPDFQDMLFVKVSQYNNNFKDFI